MLYFFTTLAIGIFLHSMRIACWSSRTSHNRGGPRISPRSSLHPLGWRHPSCTTHLPKRQRRSHERSPLVLRALPLLSWAMQIRNG